MKPKIWDQTLPSIIQNLDARTDVIDGALTEQHPPSSIKDIHVAVGR